MTVLLRPWPARAWLLAAAAVILFFATSEVPVPVVGNLWDKLQHAGAFAVLAGLADYAFPAPRFRPRLAAGLIAFGILIELIQYFIPYRDCSSLDVLADAAGIGLYGLARPVLRLLAFLRPA